MSTESTKAAFARATGRLLLNLSEEENAELKEFYGLDKPTSSQPSPPSQDEA